jgi:hypothetical protein
MKIKLIKKHKKETIVQLILSISPFVVIFVICLLAEMQKILQTVFADGGLLLVTALISKNINGNIQVYQLQFENYLKDFDGWGERLELITNIVANVLPIFYGAFKCLTLFEYNISINSEHLFYNIAFFSLTAGLITLMSVVLAFLMISKSLIKLLKSQPQKLN